MTIEETLAETGMAADEQPGFLGKLMRKAKRYAYAGVGVVAVTAEKASEFRHETVEKGIDRLAERGHEVTERSVENAGAAVAMTKSVAIGAAGQAAHLARGTVDGVSTVARERLGIASASDVQVITAQLDELNQQLDQAGIPAA